MGISLKILSIGLICSLLIHIGYSSPIDSAQILKSNGSNESSMGPIKASGLLATDPGSSSLRGTNKDSSKTEPTTNRPLQKDGLNITTDAKLINTKTVESNKSTNEGKSTLKISQSTVLLNKSDSSSEVLAKVKPLNPSVAKDDKDKKNSNENKDKMETKLDPKNSTVINIDEKSKSNNAPTLEKPKQTRMNESNLKSKDKDDRTPVNTNSDKVFKLNEDESKEKQINKPDFANYSDKKSSFYNKDDDKYDDYSEDDVGDKLQQNSNTIKQQKGMNVSYNETEEGIIMVETSNIQQTYIPNKSLEMYDDANSHFFAYLLTVMVMAVLFYLLFHNKQRIIALMIEGRGSRPSRRGSARAKYHKLDNNLEEAMSSMRDGGSASSSLNNVY